MNTQVDAVWHEHRRYLLDVAFRMLGNISDAEDVVQEAFTRLLGVDLDEIDDMRGWLVVVVSRLCLDHLRSARVRREASAGPQMAEAPLEPASPLPDPADRVTLDDSVRLALVVVLERLSPAERAVFVLHDVFQFSFDAVGSIVGRTPAACRQLASRARRRIEEHTGPARFEVETAEQRSLAERFIAASSGGDLDNLMELLDPDVVGVADVGGVLRTVRVVGRQRVAKRLLRFFGPDSNTVLVSVPVNGEAGVIAFRDRRPVAIVALRTEGGRITHFHALADRGKLAHLSALLD